MRRTLLPVGADAIVRALMAPRLPALVSSPRLRCALLAATVAAWAGCTHHVGDSCTANVDCSPLGDRFCDISQPNGYCTIEGCDVITVGGQPQDTCPSEGVCIRFFEQIGNHPCDPGAAPNGCVPSERCLCDHADPKSGACPVPAPDADGHVAHFAHCAPESSERRTCMLRCNSDGDCRQPDYECRVTGTHGAEPVPTMLGFLSSDGGLMGIASGAPARFCVQRAPAFTPRPDGPAAPPTDGGG
jgi:hypothetical protein